MVTRALQGALGFVHVNMSQLWQNSVKKLKYELSDK